MTTELARLSKSERVYRELRTRITSGRYGAGFRLVIDQVARELGVSQVPVREALRRLEAERLVTFTPNVGAEVSAVNLEDYASAMQTLALLEGWATAQSAPLLGADQLKKAEGLNRQMAALVEAGSFDPRDFSDLNQRFHAVVCHACPNDYLLRLLAEAGERVLVIRRNLFPFEPIRSVASVAEHAGILDAIRTGTPAEELERIARAHKLRTLREYMESPPQALRA